MKLGPYLTSCTKVTSKILTQKDLNGRAETVNLLEENARESFTTLDLMTDS